MINKTTTPIDISVRLREYFYPSHTSYRLKKLVTSIISRLHGKRVLDIGMRSGWLMRDLYYAGFEPTGIDVFASSLREAKFIFEQEKLPLKVIEASASKLPFKDSSFDSAIMFNVLEHMERPKSSLREARRVLKKNGILVIVVPNPGTYGLVYDVIIPRISKKLELLNTIRLNREYKKFSLPLERSLRYDDFHTLKYNASLIQKIITDAGFSILHIQNSGFISHFIASFFCGILGISRKKLWIVEYMDMKVATILPLQFGIGWLIVARKRE